MLKSNLLKILVILSIFLIILFTYNVLIITDNPVLFSIDYENKSQIINSFASLVGVILTFISILFVLENIIQQKKQYDNDKEIEVQKINNDLFSRLLFLKNCLKQTSSLVINTGKQLEVFYKLEKSQPLKSNNLEFFPNNSNYQLLQLDYLSNYKAFQVYIKDNPEQHFNSLYSVLDYYNQAIPSIKQKYENYEKEKLLKKTEIANKIEEAINISANLVYDLNNDVPLYDRIIEILNNLIGGYYEILHDNDGDETDFIELSESIFKPFIEETLTLFKEGTIPEQLQVILNSFSIIRKHIYKVKIEAEYMSSVIEDQYLNYFKTNSKSCKAIDEIILILSKTISNRESS